MQRELASACLLLNFRSGNYFQKIQLYLNERNTQIPRQHVGVLQAVNGQQFWRLSLTCTELSARRALTHTHRINLNEAIIGRQIKWCKLYPLRTSCCHTQTCCSSTLTQHEETAVISLLYRFTASSIKICVLPTYCWFQLYNPAWPIIDTHIQHFYSYWYQLFCFVFFSFVLV